MSNMKEIKCPNCGAVIPVDDATFAELLSNIKEETINEEVEHRLDSQKKLQAAEAAAAAAKEAEAAARKAAEEEARHRDEISGKDQEIERLRQQIAGYDEKKGLEIAAMQEKLSGFEKNLALEVERVRLEAKTASAEELRKKEEEISKLIDQVAKEKEVATERMHNLLDVHKKEVESLEKEVELYKNFRTSRSVKLIGETLEQHCNTQFLTNLAPVMPNATFEKDNTAVKEEGDEKGTKGDFIFRDKEDGTEYISIMFEMKNENEVSANKKKNADHFDKLDKDRKKKGCEFAVLVSMLEMDNDLYNNGIFSVPGYEKMYVVRPDNFLPIITLLVQTSKKALGYKKELAVAKSQNIDVTNFENEINSFKTLFSKNVKEAKDRYKDAIDGIDKTIDYLTKVKDNLRLTAKHLTEANNKTDDLTIRKLTAKNPTMKKAFDDARAKNAQKAALEGPEEQ